MYTIEKADLISEQLRRFTTGSARYVTGHYANIDFWLKEVLDALKAIDEHKVRFEQMIDAQKLWVDNHDSVVYNFCRICGGKCEFDDGLLILPKWKSIKELEEAQIHRFQQ